MDQWRNTSEVISTSANEIDVNVISNATSYMPGQQLKVQVRVDFYNHEIQAVMTAIIYNSDIQSLVMVMTQEGFPPLLGESGYLLTAADSYLNASLRVYEQLGKTIDIMLNSLDTSILSNSVRITLTECLFGNATTADCQCNKAANLSKVRCYDDLKVFNITPGWWFGPYQNGTGTIYTQIPSRLLQ